MPTSGKRGEHHGLNNLLKGTVLALKRNDNGMCITREDITKCF